MLARSLPLYCWCEGLTPLLLLLLLCLRSFTTGGEDGYVRVHQFDMDYFTTKFF